MMMTTTINDVDGSIEINIGKSVSRPNTALVTVFAKELADVEDVICHFNTKYGRVEFTAPVRCAGSNWGTIGHVWGEDDEVQNP